MITRSYSLKTNKDMASRLVFGSDIINRQPRGRAEQIPSSGQERTGVVVDKLRVQGSKNNVSLLLLVPLPMATVTLNLIHPTLIHTLPVPLPLLPDFPPHNYRHNCHPDDSSQYLTNKFCHQLHHCTHAINSSSHAIAAIVCMLYYHC